MQTIRSKTGRWWAACLVGLCAAAQAQDEAQPFPTPAQFEQQVAPVLSIPQEVASLYATRLAGALDSADVSIVQPQFVVLVDRNPRVQALMLWWGGAGQPWQLVGATPVSTGLPGRFEHFTTPMGVFEHAMTNPDFRAEGTKNELGIRGYGRKGSRVYDFGWVAAPKGWGDRAMSVMRLQMHSTDPDILEQRLGTAQSKGCIRIPARLNEFIDHYGILDADYEERRALGHTPWVLRADGQPTPWAGRHLVVIDSLPGERPEWSALPKAMRPRAKSK
jgi:lipoprotein-anchoring transpeptidase ErfK/SrfK